MSDVARIKSKLKYNNRSVLEVDEHDTTDIIDCMKKYHPRHTKEYDNISDRFWLGSVDKTAKGLFDFLKDNVDYRIEKEDFQTVKSPGSIINQGHGDCKHYASFITGICDSLQRKGYPIRSKYRFVADEPGKEVHHVFAVVSGQGKNIWVDPVLTGYDMRPHFYNTKDANMGSIGAVYYLSGTAVGTIEQAFTDRQKIERFLNQHGARPNQFKDPAHMMRFLAHHMKHPHQRRHPSTFINGYNSPFLVGAIGKSKKHKSHHNFLKALGTEIKKIKHGAEVNLRNAGKEIKKDADKVKNLVLKVSLSAARAPFLGLIDVNAFNLAHRLHDTASGPKRGKLEDWWKGVGGDPKHLISAINNGYREYKKHHGGYNTNMKIHGISGIFGIGVVQVAAMLALASALIAAVHKFLAPSPEDDKAMADGARDGTGALVHKAHKGMQDDQDNPGAAAALDQVVQPGQQQGSMSVSTGVDAAGNPVLAVHSVSDPSLPGGGGGEPADPAAAGIVDPGTGGGGGEAFLDKVKDFVTDKKLIVSLGITGVGLFSAMQAPKKQQKQRIALALIGGAAAYGGITYWQKKQ